MQRRLVLAGSALVIGGLAIFGASKVNDHYKKALDKTQEVIVKDAVKDAQSETLVKDEIEDKKPEPVFKVHEQIPADIKELMKGKSMPDNASGISFDDLAYLELSYHDYKGNTQVGEMVVNKKVAHEVADIFKDIYDSGFPIEKMQLVDMYDASDDKSMLDNNSSSFNFRTIAGTNVLSNHGKGLAIDINPFSNPHVVKGVANPKEAQKFANRTLGEKDMIKEGDAVYKAFTSRGWEWGGHWKNPDYQHFEKEIK